MRQVDYTVPPDATRNDARNIEQTGEFVWNLATRPLAEAMNASCAPAPAEVDEFVLAGHMARPAWP